MVPVQLKGWRVSPTPASEPPASWATPSHARLPMRVWQPTAAANRRVCWRKFQPNYACSCRAAVSIARQTLNGARSDYSPVSFTCF